MFLIWAHICLWIDSSSFDWYHELSLEIWICLFDYKIYLWYASQNTHANRVVLAFVHIVSETLVGRGSHQPVWTDHPTVRSLMLIAFWFSDELYLLILVKTFELIWYYTSFCYIISYVYIGYYLLTELLNSPPHYLSFSGS